MNRIPNFTKIVITVGVFKGRTGVITDYREIDNTYTIWLNGEKGPDVHWATNEFRVTA